MDTVRPQSRPEELVNALTHGAGVLVGVVALLSAASRALAGEAGTLALVAGVVYGVSLITLFGASSAYHAVRDERLKRVLQTVDHCAIYLLIAGTYTPFTLVTLSGAWGWALFGAVWTLAGVGLVVELSFAERLEKLSLALYLTMGWLGIFAVVPLVRALSVPALGLLCVGGLLYTSGTWFYARDRPWDHAVWHGFVLGGAGAHGLCVMGFVI